MSLNESAMQSHSLHPPDAVQGFGCSQQVFCNANGVCIDRHIACRCRRCIYVCPACAGAIKPLNVPSKFENHFAIRTVSFQVQLEAGGYFSAQKFSHLQLPQAGRVGTNLQFLNPILQIQLQNTCWASPKPDVQHKNALVSHLNDR